MRRAATRSPAFIFLGSILCHCAMPEPVNVLYCPGLDGNAREMDPVLELLPPHVTVEPLFYPTLRRTSFEDLVHLVSLRLSERPKGRRLLAGCSFGGAVAQMTALLKPQSLDALFLIVTFNHEAEAFAAAVGRAAAKVLPNFVMRPVTRLLARWKLSGGMDPDRREKFLDMISSLDPRVLTARLEILRDFDVRSRLAKIQVPVDVVYSTDDSISGSASQLEGWKRLANVRVNGIKGGHVISRQQPQAVRDLFMAWVERATETA